MIPTIPARLELETFVVFWEFVLEPRIGTEHSDNIPTVYIAGRKSRLEESGHDDIYKVMYNWKTAKDMLN